VGCDNTKDWTDHWPCTSPAWVKVLRDAAGVRLEGMKSVVSMVSSRDASTQRKLD
jgi:hypothetical protein